MSGQPISILLFADSILGIKTLYDWQAKILLNYEAGNQTAAACANFTGKTSTVFPIAALWTLYNFPRARLMYLSATGQQVCNQFFASLDRFRHRPALQGWSWLETELRTPHVVSFSVEPPTPAVTSRAYTTNQIPPPACSLTKPSQSAQKCSMHFPAATRPSASS
jgi:hypothetical protein